MKPALEKLTKHSFLLSILLVMVIFLPVNYFSFIDFDDTDVVERIHNSFHHIQWYKLFFPSYSPQYYRPLLEAICYMDYGLWGLTLPAWHLTNYILHILNACLVYQIAKIWIAPVPGQNAWAAFAMLLFALNPMTCESVAWISGRSDLAGSFFALLAIRGYYFKSCFRYIFVPGAILAGLLCKENALAVIPLIVFFEGIHTFQQKQPLTTALKKGLIWTVIVFIALIIYAVMRTNGFENYFYEFTKTATVKQLLNSSAAAQTNSLEESFYSRFTSLAPVIAFYFKKLMFPFPLNFAITQINTSWYTVLFAIIVGINTACLIKKKWALPVFCLLLFFSFSPSLMVAFDKVAWTPLAERYVYFSLPIMGVGFALFLKSLSDKKQLSLYASSRIGIAIICLFIVSTFNRQFIFKGDKTLWTATLKTNPNDSMVLCMYARAMKGQDKKTAFQKALSNPAPFKWRAKAMLKLAQIAMQEKNYEKALEQIQVALNIENTLQNCLSAASILARIPVSEQEKNKKYTKAAVAYYKKAYDKEKNALFIYNAAKLLVHLGEDKEADRLFKVILKKHPKSKYATFSLKREQRQTPNAVSAKSPVANP
nr:hypothetical protein [uncultured Desulfobacter sp.]